jgi:hypothetical protein
MGGESTSELFELCMLGGSVERRFRRMRPEIERLPWGTLRPADHAPDLVIAARKSWTLAAYQEHRTGAACAETLRALIAARAPVDLIGVATRFPLDEMVHVEMCARLAEELGGGTHVEHDARDLIPIPSHDLSPLLRAAECVVQYFCVGEALSIPLLRGTWKAASHPLIKGVLGRIVRDEALHGTFGFTFLDWASDELSEADRRHLAGSAARVVDAIRLSWETIPVASGYESTELHALGWMGTQDYLALAKRSLESRVLRPLERRGIPVKSIVNAVN